MRMNFLLIDQYLRAKYCNQQSHRVGWQLRSDASEGSANTPAEAKAVQFPHSDPQMCALFLNKVAAPIANKMFECR
jgi:hypothetical protein